MSSFKHAIALTGGISTGKSTTSNLLMLHGYLILDADKIAHKLLDKHSSWVASSFGDEFVSGEKVIRSELGKVIFSDKEAKKRLEEFIHPKIKDEIIKESKRYEDRATPYFIDIPLFFETKNYDISRSVVVYTPRDIQIERLMKRDNISKQEAIKKIENQLDIEKKRDLATFVIDNSYDLKHLQDEVEKLVNKI
jgi:dephospho-CoA kinase